MDDFSTAINLFDDTNHSDEYDLAAWRSQCPSVNTTHSDEHDLAAGKSRCSSVDALAAGGSRCSSVNAYDSGANDVARQLSQGSGESSAKCLGSVKRRVDDSPLGNMPGYSRESSYDDSHCSSLQGVKKQSTSSRLMKQSIASSRILHCEEPINLLRLQGVPAPICDLIYNMVDSINGSLMGQESYSEMFDVAHDLVDASKTGSVFRPA